MPAEKTSVPKNQIRQLPVEAELTTDSSRPPSAKLRKLEKEQRYRTPSWFWDNLSRQWFHPRALREFDRRTVWPVAPVAPNGIDKRSIPLAQLKRFARHGGPSLGDLRAYPEPETTAPSRWTMDSIQSGSRKRAKTGKSSAYDRSFEQHLVDHGIYHEGYGGVRNLPKPHNWEQIRARLAVPRASLSSSCFTREAFLDFQEKNQDALTEGTIISAVFPIIAGSARIPHSENLPFGNLKDLTDGSLAKAEPGFYDGSRPTELSRQAREDLGPYIIPSTNTAAPCLPNFFAEGKGPTGSTAVCKRQALYDGALSAHGIHELLSYTVSETLFDNNAYTITSTYHQSGLLTIYTTHPTPSEDPTISANYHMTQLRSFAMTDSPDSFRQGAGALRNARDWAKEKRDELIAAANGNALNTEYAGLDSSTSSMLSPSTNELVHEKSGTSTDETAVSSSHRTSVGARGNPPAEASSDRHLKKGSRMNKRSARGSEVSGCVPRPRSHEPRPPLSRISYYLPS